MDQLGIMFPKERLTNGASDMRDLKCVGESVVGYVMPKGS
jgi:hypothetical protein